MKYYEARTLTRVSCLVSDADTDMGHGKIQKKGYGDTVKNILLLSLYINKIIKFQSSKQQTKNINQYVHKL